MKFPFWLFCWKEPGNSLLLGVALLQYTAPQYKPSYCINFLCYKNLIHFFLPSLILLSCKLLSAKHCLNVCCLSLSDSMLPPYSIQFCLSNRKRNIENVNLIQSVVRCPTSVRFSSILGFCVMQMENSDSFINKKVLADFLYCNL